jgi:hypothetical protein
MSPCLCLCDHGSLRLDDPRVCPFFLVFIAWLSLRWRERRVQPWLAGVSSLLAIWAGRFGGTCFARFRGAPLLALETIALLPPQFSEPCFARTMWVLLPLRFVASLARLAGTSLICGCHFHPMILCLMILGRLCLPLKEYRSCRGGLLSSLHFREGHFCVLTQGSTLKDGWKHVYFYFLSILLVIGGLRNSSIGWFRFFCESAE